LGEILSSSLTLGGLFDEDDEGREEGNEEIVEELIMGACNKALIGFPIARYRAVA
jgi:hypothetical protein